MPEYKCNNKDCIRYDKIVSKNSITKIVNGELVDSALKCPICSKDRELIIKDGMTTMMHGGPNVCKK